MRKLIITTLLAGMAAFTSIQISYAAGVGGVGAGNPGINTGSTTTTGMGNGGLSNEAGSIAAGANSALNPSGNSFLVPPAGEAIGGAQVFRGGRR